MAPSRHDWKIVDWDVKPQHNQPTNQPTNHFKLEFDGTDRTKYGRYITKNRTNPEDMVQNWF